MKEMVLTATLSAMCGAGEVIAADACPAEHMRRYDVVWESPSKDATGVMPMGNGDIAAGVYAVEDGDLFLLLSKNDAFNFRGELYKTGRVRISIEPNPFRARSAFKQTLDLTTGAIIIESDGVTVRAWTDANRPVYHIEIASDAELTVKAQPEFWTRLDGTEDVCVDRDDTILWYFPVGNRSVYPEDLDYYDVEHMAEHFPDPYRYNTFGNLLESPGMTVKDGVLSGSGTQFDIRIHAHAMQTPDARTWIEAIHKQAIAPAETWSAKHNAENGGLYPVFPFRCFGLGLGSEDIVEWTMAHRSCKDAFGNRCWTQDQIHWAYAGRATEARDGLVRRFRAASRKCRFPLYGRKGPDSCPDFDHFGAGATALQRMLVQEGETSSAANDSDTAGKILLLPAWPANWDVDFRLHAVGGAVVTGTVKDGTLLAWDIEPASRRKDVVVHQPQAAPPPPCIPSNSHPLRAGSDQSGENRFRGKIGRVTMFRGGLAPETIAGLASSDKTQAVESEQVTGCWLNPTLGAALPSEPEDFTGPVSFEAWIQPADGESGRILDKLTPGVNNGMLLDTWPKLSLRLIVGSAQQLDLPGVLKSGRWHHVAVVIGHGVPRVYLDGKPVAPGER